MTKRTFNLCKAVTQKYGMKLDRVKPYDSLYKKKIPLSERPRTKGTLPSKPFTEICLSPDYRRESRSDGFFSYADLLKQSGYPHMPSWLQTSSGRSWVNHNESYYYMMEWVEGRNLELNEEDFANLGRALARLHTACTAEALPAMGLRTLTQMRFFYKPGPLVPAALGQASESQEQGHMVPQARKGVHPVSRGSVGGVPEG